MATVSGVSAMVEKIRAIARNTPARAAAALYAEAEVEMTESKRRVPWETGNLRATGHVTPPAISGSTVTVWLSYGGPAADYAVPVHENLEAHHPHGQAKYLESVLVEARGSLGARLAKRLNLESAPGATSAGVTL